MQSNICEQAEAYRLLLLMGVVGKSEIISWADRIIDAHPTVPGWLLDISLAANCDLQSFESRMHDIPGECSPEATAYLAMTRFAKEFQVNCRFTSFQAARMLKVWASIAKVSVNDWTIAMLPGWIAEKVAYGYSTEREVIEAIDKCVAHFSVMRPASLSSAARLRLELVFPKSLWAEAERLLVEECGSDLPGGSEWTSSGIDRIRFAAMKTSGGSLEGLRQAIELGKQDFRDLLMSAGFGLSFSSYLLWMPSRDAE